MEFEKESACVAEYNSVLVSSPQRSRRRPTVLAYWLQAEEVSRVVPEAGERVIDKEAFAAEVFVRISYRALLLSSTSRRCVGDRCWAHGLAENFRQLVV